MPALAHRFDLVQSLALLRYDGTSVPWRAAGDLLHARWGPARAL